MPAYEYECRDCGDHFEQRQKMSEPEIDACPACNGAVKRLISGGAGAISKGGASTSAPACGLGNGACEMPASMGCGGGCACH